MLSLSVRQHICLSCRLCIAARAASPAALKRSPPVNTRPLSSINLDHARSSLQLRYISGNLRRLDTDENTSDDGNGEESLASPTQAHAEAPEPADGDSHGENTAPASPALRSIRLSLQKKNELAIVERLGERLRHTARNLAKMEGVSGVEDLMFEKVLENMGLKRRAKGFKRVTLKLRELYEGRTFAELDRDLRRVAPFRPSKRVGIECDDDTIKILKALDLLEGSLVQDASAPAAPTVKKSKSSAPAKSTKPRIRAVASKGPPLKVARKSIKDDAGRSLKIRANLKSSITPGRKGKKELLPVLDTKLMREANVETFQLVPLEIETSKVPSLSHDLTRVLFNPGIYQLQDPRSRVWNFDPYLGNLMPVSEFNFDALNKYITSSEDTELREIAVKQGKRYVGSTSSMSGVMSHFHFLLSGWRRLNLEHLSRAFKDDGEMFTKIQRGPTAIFLRYKDGVHAVDADKEFDSANVLMSLGRSMEKLLTLEKDEFERFRRTQDAEKDAQFQSTEREAYHYSELGQFLLRSQLDAHDPRLPGTGMFDLKTRAVAAVRMMVHNHEVGAGYQIKERLGTWESFEREYYDMMRSAFLKYSLQVRMGRMDGIFVAFHNTERLFGFQYIPLSEMDFALHGQSDSTLGDREFRFSIKLLNDVFDEATAKHPKQSLRFHFEAREATASSAAHMYIFAEPVSDEEILEIQNSKKEEIRAFEQRIFNPRQRQPTDSKEGEGEEEGEIDDAPEREGESLHPSDGSTRSTSTELDSVHSPSAEKQPNSPTSTTSTTRSNAANVAFLDSILGLNLHDALSSKPTPGRGDVPRDTEAPGAQEPITAKVEEEELPTKPILAWKLHIRNIVNGLPVSRPENLTSSSTWNVQYTLTPLAEAAGRRNYLLCKNRRKAHLEAPQDADEAASFYIRRLIDLSRSGAKWRENLDQFDAQRDQVVLYGDRGAMASEK